MKSQILVVFMQIKLKNVKNLYKTLAVLSFLALLVSVFAIFVSDVVMPLSVALVALVLLLEVEKKKGTFMGFKRKQGRAGIRNEIYIIPTVGCVNNTCIRMEKMAQKFVKGSIDGIFTLSHQFGCSQLGDDNENIKKLLSFILILSFGLVIVYSLILKDVLTLPF